MEAAGRSPRALGVRGGRCVLRDSWVEVVTAVSFSLFLSFVLYMPFVFSSGERRMGWLFFQVIYVLWLGKKIQWERKSP